MKNTPGVQFADNILSSDYTMNLSVFKRIVKSKFAGTIFENSVLPKLSDRDPDAITDRSLLASAFENLAQYPGEAEAIQRYKEVADKLDAEQQNDRVSGGIESLSPGILASDRHIRRKDAQ